MKTLTSISPATLEEVQSYPIHSSEETAIILSQAQEAQKTWAVSTISLRSNCLEQLAGVLKDRAREYAKLMAQEMGKPLVQGVGEVEKCAWLCEYYREHGEEFLMDRPVETGNAKSFVAIEPLGLVLGVMPWNFPFWQVFRFALPAITAGNGAILKHASNVQGCAAAIEACFMEAGYPDNIFRNLVIPGTRVKEVIEHEAIAAVTLTGSTPAGKAVAAAAGAVLKKTVLELGGSDPYVILDDADLDQAVAACVAGRLLNAGQSCIAAKRLIVTRENEVQFIDRLEQELNNKVVGDPMDEVDMGPMVSIAARDEVHDQVQRSIASGAALKIGGAIPAETGAYYPITLLTDVKPGMAAFDEELFGPVFTVVTAEDEDHALGLANQTEFGLGAAVFTADLERGEEIARKKLHAGACFVNDFVKSDPRLPFGGIKNSGYGRELSVYGMMEFVNVKTIVVNKV